MPFDGLRVLSLESRRAAEIATLIRNHGGDPFVAPSMREAPLEENDHVFTFGHSLLAGEFDMMIFLTGVGTRALHKLLITRIPEPEILEALGRLTKVVRGPKPAAALRELKLTIDISVPEPNTWRELLTTIAGREGKRIAIQEYGRTNEELVDALQQRGSAVTTVRIYQWQLPEDTTPLRDAALRLSRGEFDVALFTTAMQVPHLLKMAAEQGVEAETLEALRHGTAIASIGPTCSEMLDDYGIPTDITPSHPKMGFLVKEAGEQAHAVLERKRAAT
ncbi:MAG: uroporphyrinogen-III synthase [Acidobacteria bacterium]|nr:uroporphyrinogen-III synthase [Acidobacteriota bacterium]